MVIRYRLRRSDLWWTYLHVARRNRSVKLKQAALFGIGFGAPLVGAAGSEADWGIRFGAAVVTGLLAVALVPLYLLCKYKPEERRLRIGSAGMSTTIGDLSGDVSWNDVSEIADAADCIYIVGTSGNAMRVPNDAFASESERAEFLELARGWWIDAGSS